MKKARFWGIGLILLLLWGPGVGRAADDFRTWPKQIYLTLQPEVPLQTPLPWGPGRKIVNIRIDTRRLSGQSWRLWIAPRANLEATPSSLPAQVIHWEGRTPFQNGTLLPNQRVLAGQGPIRGQLVEGNLIFWARGDAPAAGHFPIQLDFILETLP